MTKPNIRWQLLLALSGLGLILALLSFQAQSGVVTGGGGLCTTRIPAEGGSLVEGIIGVPQTINPLLSDDNPVDQELVALVFDGLTRYDENGLLVPVLAESWTVSEDGLTVTFTLRDDVRWQDGEPFTAADVVFSYQLLQNPDFPAPAGVRALWETVTIASETDNQVSFTLTEPYSPFLEMTTRGIVPAHVLGDVPAAEIADHEFNRFPVGTGPFGVSRSENWPRTGRLRLLPNPPYWPNGIQLADLVFRFYPDNNSLIAAYAAGDIQAINNIPPTFLPDYIQLPGLRLFTAPYERYSQVLFNLSPTGNGAIAQAEVRQALVQGLDRRALLDANLHGQGILLEGPYLPSSWAYNENLPAAQPYDPAGAAAALDAAGWTVPEGSSVRQQAGTPLIFRLVYWDVPPYRDIAQNIADQWAALNVRVELVGGNRPDYLDALAGRAFDLALVDVAPPGDPDLYDFWSQEAIVDGQNYAGWNNQRASEALEAARQVWPVGDRAPHYAAFLAYYDNDLPAITLYQHVYNYGINESVQGVEIGRIDAPRERYETLADWTILFRDAAVACPEPDL
jgi:peptide/nickel transport system substrate-binding protein